MPMPKFIARLAALLLIPLAGLAHAAGSPADTVTGLHNALIDNMKRGSALGCSGRIQHMGPAVDASFDLPWLAQRILRKHWSELSDAQHERFIANLRDMVVTTYAAQFTGYNGESFSNESTEDAGDNKVVHAKFKHGDTTSFDYVLRGTDGNWRIVNVIADGVSDLAIRSAQYESVYKQGGYDGLIKYLQEQVAKNKAGC